MPSRKSAVSRERAHWPPALLNRRIEPRFVLRAISRLVAFSDSRTVGDQHIRQRMHALAELFRRHDSFTRPRR
jgi:hypothetical protein